MRFLLLALALVMTSQAHANLSVSPWWLDFRDVPVGATNRSEFITLRNNGRQTIDRIQVSDNCFGDFEVRNSTCRYRLEPFRSCELRIYFRPRREGMQSCMIQFRTIDSYETLNVQGRGVKKAPTPAPLMEDSNTNESVAPN